MKRKKGRTKQIILIILGLELIFIVAILLYIQFRPSVVKAVTMEAGTHDIKVEDFLRGNRSEGSFFTDINSLDLNKPGIYEVQIKVGEKIFNSTIEVVDTTPPLATTVNQVIVKDDAIDAISFVTNISDSTSVTVSYQNEPDFSKVGNQEVALELTDTSNNRSNLKAILTILDMNKTVTVEAGSSVDITANDFISNNQYEVTLETDLKKLDISKPAIHEIKLIVDGKPVIAYLEVVDTVPPKAEVKNLEIWSGDKPEAMEFITNVINDTNVTAAFKNMPDFTLPGEQTVVIVIKDESGNSTELSAVLTVKEDKEAPVITGVTDKTVFIGDAVSYKKGVTVTDNRDDKITFTVDSSKVNLKKVGSYSVVYSAADKAGNKTEVSATISVEELLVTEEELAEMAADILKNITSAGMTQREIAYEIYRWTKGHIAYTGNSDKSDWRNEAYRGIKNAVGDCFTYFAVSKALLNKAGIENMDVTRVGGRTRHYWSLINCGDGWYHFDSCPNKDHKETFMMTDAEVEAYTNQRGNNYYTFDKTKFPATPEE